MCLASKECEHILSSKECEHMFCVDFSWEHVIGFPRRPLFFKHLMCVISRGKMHAPLFFSSDDDCVK